MEHDLQGMGPPNYGRIAEIAEEAVGSGSLSKRATSCGKSALEGVTQVGGIAAMPDGGDGGGRAIRGGEMCHSVLLPLMIRYNYMYEGFVVPPLH